MKILSQRDPQWASDHIGASKLTLGRWGCTTTAISMLSDYFTCYKSPKELAHNAHFFTLEGLMVWKNLQFTNMKFVKRTYNRNDATIREALKHKDKAVILEVANHSHWVVGLRPTLIGNSYIVADPWDGKKVDVLKRYKNITGAAFFERKT